MRPLKWLLLAATLLIARVSPGQDAAKSIDSLLQACREQPPAAAPADYQTQLAELAELRTKLAAGATADEVARAGQLVEWIEKQGGKGPELAQSIRHAYCQNNAGGQVSARLMNHMLSQTVYEQRTISDVMLGAQTRGTAVTQGTVTFATVPFASQGCFEIRFDGRADCPDTQAQRRRVGVESTSHSDVHARKQIHVSDQGLVLLLATVAATSSVQIRDIDAPRALIERLAWRKANQMLPEAEAAMTGKVRQETIASLDHKANAQLGNVNEMFTKQMQGPLKESGALPAAMQFTSSATHLRFEVSQHSKRQLSPAGQTPSVAADRDIAIWAHESMINNLCDSLVAGKTAKDQLWLDIMNIALGSSPRPLWVHDRSERWSVTFAAERPVRVHFGEERIEIKLRCSALHRDTTTDTGPFEIRFSLRPVCSPEGPTLLREAPLQVDFADSQEKDSEVQRKFISHKFSAVFPPELFFDGLVPPEGGSIGKLRRLELKEFQSASGWVTLGYQLQAKE